MSSGSIFIRKEKRFVPVEAKIRKYMYLIAEKRKKIVFVNSKGEPIYWSLFAYKRYFQTIWIDMPFVQ